MTIEAPSVSKMLRGRVEGRLPEMVWLVWADEKPFKPNVERTEKLGYGIGLAALGCLAAGAVAFARGGKGRSEYE